MMRRKMLIAATLCTFNGALMGCGTAPVQPPTSSLAWPAAHFMKEPPSQPDIKEGDDLYGALAKSRATLSERNATIRGLQRYIRLIHKKRKGTS